MREDLEAKKIQKQFNAQSEVLQEVHAISSGSAYGRFLFWLEQGVPTKDLIAAIRTTLDSNVDLKFHAEEMFRDLMAKELENQHKMEQMKSSNGGGRE